MGTPDRASRPRAEALATSPENGRDGLHGRTSLEDWHTIFGQGQSKRPLQPRRRLPVKRTNHQGFYYDHQPCQPAQQSVYLRFYDTDLSSASIPNLGPNRKKSPHPGAVFPLVIQQTSGQTWLRNRGSDPRGTVFPLPPVAMLKVEIAGKDVSTPPDRKCSLGSRSRSRPGSPGVASGRPAR